MGDVVLRDQPPSYRLSQSGLKRPAKDGDSPVGTNRKKMGRNPRVPHLGLGVKSWKPPTSKTKYVSRPIAH
jgi:hypothetical protein